MFTIAFFVNSILLGIGLAMDAFSVSLANGLNEPQMNRKRIFLIAGTFSAFQFIMPEIGWFMVHTLVQYFEKFEKFIPWIALILLIYIGGKMLIEGIKGVEDSTSSELGAGALIIQGIATSIDALSVGFTVSDYNVLMATAASLIIGIVTLFICMGGLLIGKKFGTKLAGKASILGGCILIFIGIEIFVKGVF